MARQHSDVRGLTWYDDRLEAVLLPRASTGTAGNAAVVCLRAITTALALFSIETVMGALTHVIPHCLVNYELKDHVTATDGPFLSCLHQCVVAVDAE